MGRIMTAFRAFFAVLSRGGEAIKFREERKVEPAAPSEKPAADCLDLLSRLQERARFVDFLTEDISGLDDAQVGAAVRNIHRDLKKTLDEYFKLEPIVEGAEGDPVEVPAGFDAYAFRLQGQVAGNPPYRGRIVHPGWRAVAVTLPARAEEATGNVVHPAEIEMGG